MGDQRRMHFIVEGQTELRFIQSVLTPWFNEEIGIYSLTCSEISKKRKRVQDRGGFVDFRHLRHDLLRSAQADKLVLTTMIDYYALPDNFPGKQTLPPGPPLAQVTYLQNQLSENLEFPPSRVRFVPYIQLHEFEALMFSSADIFRNRLEGDQLNQIQQVIEQYPNPEDINSGPQTAPSKRLRQIWPRYRKPFAADLIADHLDIHTLRARCPHFRDWLERLGEAWLQLPADSDMP